MGSGMRAILFRWGWIVPGLGTVWMVGGAYVVAQVSDRRPWPPRSTVGRLAVRSISWGGVSCLAIGSALIVASLFVDS